MQKTTATVAYLLIPLGMMQLLFFFYVFYWYSKDHIFHGEVSNHAKHILQNIIPPLESTSMDLPEIKSIKTAEAAALNTSSSSFAKTAEAAALNTSLSSFAKKNLRTSTKEHSESSDMRLKDSSKEYSESVEPREIPPDGEASWEDIAASAAQFGIQLKPKSFDISDLPFPYEEEEPEFNDWIRTVVKRRSVFKAKRGLIFQPCGAAFGLDVAALKYLLYDVGVPADMPQQDDHNRTALLCLSNIQLLADANSRGLYIPIITGNQNWLSKILDPPLPVQDPNPMASDIVHSMEKAAVNCARWLLRAGADPNARDRVRRHSPLKTVIP